MCGNVRRIFLGLLLTFVLFAMCKPGAAQAVLYDDFNNVQINPSNWLGLQHYDLDLREVKREITATPGVKNDHRLHLLERAYSATTDNVGGTADGIGLLFATPSSITAMSMTVVVKKALAVGCAANSVVAGITTGFGGAFFNPSNSPDPTGDVRAFVSIMRFSTDTGKGLTVGAGYYQCGDAGCTPNPLFSQALGVVQPGSSNTLALTWDRANHQFIFQLNSNAPIASTYTLGDSFPPAGNWKYISEDRTVPHCTSTPRPYAFADAYFDNVYVNP